MKITLHASYFWAWPHAVPVHEDRRLQPGGELQHYRRPLRWQADEPGVRPRGGPARHDAADAPWAAGPVLPSDEQRYHAADAATSCWVRAGHARQQPVPGGAERAPIGGCHAGVDVSRRVGRVMPRCMCLEINRPLVA